MIRTDKKIFDRPLVFVSAYLGGPHGTAKSARDFLRALLANHSDVKVVSPVREEFPSHLCGYQLSRPYWLTAPSKFAFRPWNLRLSNVKAWIQEKYVRYEFKKQVTNSMVIVNGWASYNYWLSVQSYCSGPKVLIIRESPRHFEGIDREQPLLEMIKVFSTFDHLIFVSEIIKSEWLQNESIKHIGHSVLPNCCEEEEATECLHLDRDLVRAQYGFTPDDFIVFCPGTVEHRKGQDLLLKVVPILQNTIPNLRVLFVGDVVTEWGRNIIRSIPNEIQGTTVLHWHSKPGILQLLRASDILAFPSRAEAMPRTILEAMAIMIPVVASSVDGVPELIEHNRTGLLFECNDSEGLCNGILSLYSEPQTRKQLAEAGYVRYWNQFSRTHQFVRMKEILNNLGAV